GVGEQGGSADTAWGVAHGEGSPAEIEAVLTTRPTAHWLASLAEAGVPAAEVADLAQALDRPQAKALGAVQELGHPAAGAYRLVGPPLRIDRAALAYPAPAPRLGSDTRAVLCEAGPSSADLTRLRRGRAVMA